MFTKSHTQFNYSFRKAFRKALQTMTKYQATWGRNLQKKKPKKHEGFSQIKIFNLNLKKKNMLLELETY